MMNQNVLTWTACATAGLLLTACQATAPRQGAAESAAQTAVAKPVITAPVSQPGPGSVLCAKTGIWTWLAGSCDNQLRTQGVGTLLAGSDPGLAFTGPIKDGLPDGTGSMVAIKRNTTSKRWDVPQGAVKIPVIETRNGEILSRELSVGMSRTGNSTQAGQVNARITTTDTFRFEQPKSSEPAQISVELGELLLTATRVEAGTFQANSEATGFRHRPAEVTGRIRDGFINGTHMEFNVNSGKIRTTDAGKLFEYDGPMRVSCWGGASCSVRLLGLLSKAGPAGEAATQTEKVLTIAGQSYTIVPSGMGDFVLYFKGPDGTVFDARIPECAKQQRGARMDTRNNTQPPKLMLANTCGHLRTPSGVDFKGTFDARGNPIAPNN